MKSQTQKWTRKQRLATNPSKALENDTSKGDQEGPRPCQARPARGTPECSDPGTPTAQPQAGASLLVTRAHGPARDHADARGQAPCAHPPGTGSQRTAERWATHTHPALGGPPRWATARGINVPKSRKEATNSRAQSGVRTWGGEDRSKVRYGTPDRGGTRPHSRKVSTKDGFVKHEPG